MRPDQRADFPSAHLTRRDARRRACRVVRDRQCRRWRCLVSSTRTIGSSRNQSCRRGRCGPGWPPRPIDAPVGCVAHAVPLLGVRRALLTAMGEERVQLLRSIIHSGSYSGIFGSNRSPSPAKGPGGGGALRPCGRARRGHAAVAVSADSDAGAGRRHAPLCCTADGTSSGFAPARRWPDVVLRSTNSGRLPGPISSCSGDQWRRPRRVGVPQAAAGDERAKALAPAAYAVVSTARASCLTSSAVVRSREPNRRKVRRCTDIGTGATGGHFELLFTRFRGQAVAHRCRGRDRAISAASRQFGIGIPHRQSSGRVAKRGRRVTTDWL